jgi:hypothetical protein
MSLRCAELPAPMRPKSAARAFSGIEHAKNGRRLAQLARLWHAGVRRRERTQRLLARNPPNPQPLNRAKR